MPVNPYLPGIGLQNGQKRNAELSQQLMSRPRSFCTIKHSPAEADVS